MKLGDKIIGIRKNEFGEISMVKLNNGRVMTLDEVRLLVSDGQIDSLTEIDANGNWTIDQSYGDATPESGSNLDMLPGF